KSSSKTSSRTLGGLSPKDAGAAAAPGVSLDVPPDSSPPGVRKVAPITNAKTPPAKSSTLPRLARPVIQRGGRAGAGDGGTVSVTLRTGWVSGTASTVVRGGDGGTFGGGPCGGRASGRGGSAGDAAAGSVGGAAAAAGSATGSAG